MDDEVVVVMVPFPGQARRVGVVHDFLMSYKVQDFSSFPNIESYIFLCTSSFDMYCSHKCRVAGMPIPLEEEQLKKLPSLKGCYPDDIFVHLGAFQTQYISLSTGDIYNTSQVVEVHKTRNNGQSDLQNEYCLDWLNKQPPKSVLYVSFGTTTSFSGEQIKELAMGLELSKQNFIWVLRDADEVDNSGKSKKLKLPEGFEERAKGVGLVVREWAPQPEILAHPSTGRFLSHCGWNSCIESITLIVPIATWPMHYDQPKNGFLVTEILKIGLAVREWEKRDELITASAIENVVRKLMTSEEGDVIRNKAKELGEAVRQSTQKGGAARMELESFIAHITR
ncbi:zeatin O-xylosyltransferase-like [Nicotiana tabacum]|uniref:Zeatin O-xylosyltransferase-like n=1 Tax=Nicotiana tabacum TaxID=4097 RepID=A0AC58UIZ7_TOBAC|nr:UDP-glycosyltransferase [Nicotiana tabacum]